GVGIGKTTQIETLQGPGRPPRRKARGGGNDAVRSCGPLRKISVLRRPPRKWTTAHHCRGIHDARENFSVRSIQGHFGLEEANVARFEEVKSGDRHCCLAIVPPTSSFEASD